MSSRAVLSFACLGPGNHVLRLEESITVLAPDAQTQALVDLAGILVAGQSHDAAGTGLFGFLVGQAVVRDQLVASRRNGFTLLIEDEAPEAQGLPWECLRDAAGEFLALDASPLVCRTVTPKKQLKPLTRTWTPPLQVLAVLAATGKQPDGRRLTAIKELQALVAGLDSAPAMPYRLRVLGCDDELDDATPDTDPKLWIEQQDDGDRLSYDRLESLGQIEDEIERLEPHVVHLFCHGFADPDRDNLPPHLELALRFDQLARKERGQLRVEARELGDILAAHPATWLVVLNCCLGAAAGESISFARELMSDPDLDLPAVVAMREAIDRRDAHLFCERFYDTMTDELAAAIADAKPRDLLWAQTLPPVRQALCKARCQSLASADRCAEWTLPVLYVRREPFQLVEPGHGLPPAPVAPAADVGPPQGDVPANDLDAEEILGQLRIFKDIREELVQIPNLPPDRIAKVDARIAELRRKLLEVA